MRSCNKSACCNAVRAIAPSRSSPELLLLLPPLPLVLVLWLLRDLEDDEGLSEESLPFSSCRLANATAQPSPSRIFNFLTDSCVCIHIRHAVCDSNRTGCRTRSPSHCRPEYSASSQIPVCAFIYDMLYATLTIQAVERNRPAIAVLNIQLLHRFLCVHVQHILRDSDRAAFRTYSQTWL